MYATMAVIWRLTIICYLAFGLEARAQDVMACYRGKECPQGYYCMSHIGYCHRCIDCSAYNRRPSRLSYSHCVRSQDQCGDCLDGYFMPPHSGSSNYFCLSINTTDMPVATQQHGNDNTASNSIPMFVAYIFLGIIVLGFISLVLISLIYKKKIFNRRSGQTGRTATGDVEGNLFPPPSYSQAVCSAPSLVVNRDYLNAESTYQDEESTEGLVVCRKERETNQAATCFIVPASHRRLSLPLDNSEEIDSNNSLEPTELIPVGETEENTMESIWTSNTDTPNEEVNLSSALAEAAGTRIISQPSSIDDVPEAGSPPKRLRSQEESPNENAGTQFRDPANDKVSLIVVDSGNVPSISSSSNGTISVDLNKNILNQSSLARFNRGNDYHQADNSSDDDAPTNSSQAKFFNGNLVVVSIQQNMKMKK